MVGGARRSPSLDLSELEFDSQFLGGRVFRLAFPTGDDASDARPFVVEYVQRALAARATLVVSRVPVDAPWMHEILESAGFRRIERLLTYRRALERLPTSPLVRLARREDADSCAELARSSFVFDRYHTDPRIDSSAADTLKGAWAANGINGRADVAFVAEEHSRIRGFILCLRTAGDAIVDLIAVSPEARGKGIGRELTAAAIAHYAQRGDVRNISASTQATNGPSMRLYQSLGFLLVREAFTYHLMPN
jgi:ribosomal protein S18 acetylase RimI-like enzyme